MNDRDIETIDALRTRVGKLMVPFLWAHLPVLWIAGLLADSDATLPVLAISAAISAAATVTLRGGAGSLTHRGMCAAALVAQVSLLVFQLRGTPWQIDMHMYFFAALAIVAAFCCSRTILLAAGITAVHHLLLNLAIPQWVFPDGGDIGRVVFHAAIVILQTGVLIALIGRLDALFERSGAALAESLAATGAAEARADEARAAREEAQTALDKARRSEAEQEALRAERRAERLREEATRREQMLAIAGDFEATVGAIIREVVEAAGQFARSSEALSGLAGDGTRECVRVGEATGRVRQNVAAVAAGAEELTSSINEISNQVDGARRVAEEAAGEARASTENVRALSEQAERIDDVLSLIGDIAEQTNLLALNATIEAARAGEAGKGFAVVASEVKALAGQSAKASNEIGQRIVDMRQVTEHTVASTESIARIVERLHEGAAAIAAAVEEQDAATREIARAAQIASDETGDAAGSVEDVGRTIADVEQAASLAREASNRLADQARLLTERVEDFVGRIRGDGAREAA